MFLQGGGTRKTTGKCQWFVEGLESNDMSWLSKASARLQTLGLASSDVCDLVFQCALAN